MSSILHSKSSKHPFCKRVKFESINQRYMMHHLQPTDWWCWRHSLVVKWSIWDVTLHLVSSCVIPLQSSSSASLRSPPLLSRESFLFPVLTGSFIVLFCLSWLVIPCQWQRSTMPKPMQCNQNFFVQNKILNTFSYFLSVSCWRAKWGV